MNLASSRVSDCYNILTHPRQFPSIPLVAEPAEERGGGKQLLTIPGGKRTSSTQAPLPTFCMRPGLGWRARAPTPGSYPCPGIGSESLSADPGYRV
ncbi:hypothetical protein BO85DRAFT_454106 [Aspergillus piperis CBS 112811]|uniref:Uncharacterized protein n=1 Tax=Aspergillus piperis CBS 112811 TaxID=1448313 RepID=A0A8G1VJ58_9EURO|nr:hypothetical protein BO85DRAFT_454106 [Aspergillus piperis CBS 112811]RAH52403.1 hypothetical protein BO85DRAFT_454106 [Aspergillus piperis CBS 112811]